MHKFVLDLFPGKREQMPLSSGIISRPSPYDPVFFVVFVSVMIVDEPVVSL